MKKISLGRNVKFALILSVASLMGIKASQAVKVFCPLAQDLEEPTQLPEGAWEYKATSIGGGFIFSGRDIKLTLHPHALPEAFKLSSSLACRYHTTYTNVYLTIRTKDAAASKCNPDPTRRFFICPD